MHRQSPLTAGFVGYSGGGARALVDTVDDGTGMQEMKGSMMFGEARGKIESPQNYGFTSVAMPAKKGKNGQIEESAEAYVSFIGGNRSFPVASVMDDRRYRLKELKPGDVAMFDHQQHQLHFNKDGVFITGRTDKKMKFQLFDPPEEKQEQGGGKATGKAVGADAASSGQSGGQKKNGQKQRYDKEGKQYLEMTKDKTNLVHDQGIDYKTATHSFQPSSSSSPAAQSLGAAAASSGGGPLVQIFGDKFTGGAGHFMKQVTAAPPISSGHVATKGYVDSIFASLGITIPALPSLPMPSLPPGVTVPPGITFPLPGAAAEAFSSGEAVSLVVDPPMPESLAARLLVLERRLAELESAIRLSAASLSANTGIIVVSASTPSRLPRAV